MLFDNHFCIFCLTLISKFPSQSFPSIYTGCEKKSSFSSLGILVFFFSYGKFKK